MSSETTAETSEINRSLITAKRPCRFLEFAEHETFTKRECTQPRHARGVSLRPQAPLRLNVVTAYGAVTRRLAVSALAPLEDFDRRWWAGPDWVPLGRDHVTNMYMYTYMYM